jgi:hypothetical protein
MGRALASRALGVVFYRTLRCVARKIKLSRLFCDRWLAWALKWRQQAERIWMEAEDGRPFTGALSGTHTLLRACAPHLPLRLFASAPRTSTRCWRTPSAARHRSLPPRTCWLLTHMRTLPCNCTALPASRAAHSFPLLPRCGATLITCLPSATAVACLFALCHAFHCFARGTGTATKKKKT